MPIDCAIGKNPNISVFCYLFNPNPAAIGSAYSIVKLITGAITVYFNIAVYLAFKNRNLLIILQVLLLVPLIAFIALNPSLNFTRIDFPW